ncbi:hypothetical protein MKZ17_08420 [Solibacillus sp. FSL R7-0682]|uniref:hypothetical protein n=1 Tax=Solibacillus sp. FSL R7-0682 TaxID=2921690 RepID=UPI0030F8B9E3
MEEIRLPVESWERGASAAAILGGPLVKGVKHGAKLGAKAISGATSSSKAKTKTVNLAKSPTPTNPPKQQAPSSPGKLIKIIMVRVKARKVMLILIISISENI